MVLWQVIAHWWFVGIAALVCVPLALQPPPHMWLCGDAAGLGRESQRGRGTRWWRARDSAQVFPSLLCAAAMKMRAPGTQLVAQTAWMLSLPNPKLGACKFAPMLQCCWGWGGSAGREEVWGSAVAPVPTGNGACPAGYDGDGAGLPGAGLAGMLLQGGPLVQGGSAGAGQALLLPLGCCMLPGAHGQAASCHHHHQTEGGWDPAPSLGRLFSPTAVICSLCSFGLWYQGSSKDPPASTCSGAWEIIDSLDPWLEPEGESEPVASSPDRATPPL